MPETPVDERLVRLHAHYLGHARATELRVAAASGREQEAAEWAVSAGRPLAASSWVTDAQGLIDALEAVWAAPDAPFSCALMLAEARRRMVAADAFGQRPSERAGDADVTGVQTLRLGIEPVTGEVTESALAACIELGRWIADWAERERGWQRPLLVNTGEGCDVYFALPQIVISDENRDETRQRLAGFRALVAAACAEPAKAWGVAVAAFGGLTDAARVWGTAVAGVGERRWCHPLEDSPVRREDMALWSTLLLDRALLTLAAALEPTPGLAELWGLEAIADLDGRDLEDVPPIECDRVPAARLFFADLNRQLQRVGGERDVFMWRVQAALVGLYALERRLPPEEGARALAGDRPALRRVYRQWAHVHSEIWEPAWHAHHLASAFMQGLRTLDDQPAKLAAFLQAEGLDGRPGLLPPTPCPTPFRPAIVGWEQRRAAQAAWMAAKLSLGQAGLFVNNAEPSVSKTGAALALMAAHPDKRFLYLAPSHALLQDVQARAIAAGIPATDLFIAQGLERLCTYPQREATILKEARLGRDARGRYCEPKGGACGLAATCGWHTQKAAGQAARILLAPSAYLAQETHFGFLLAKAWGNDTRHAIVIDEDASGYMGLRYALPAAPLEVYRDALSHRPHIDAPYTEPLVGLLDFLLDFMADPMQPMARFTPDPMIDDALWREARRRVRRAMGELYLGSDDIDYTALLESLVEDPQSPVTFYRDADGSAYTFRATPPLPDKPVFLLDGTAVHAYYERAFRRDRPPEFFLPPASPAERSYIAPAGRLVQLVDSGYSRSRLREEPVFTRVLNSVRAFVTQRRAEAPDRRCLLITYMDQPGAPYESRFRRSLADLGVEVAHFGNIRGLDHYNGWDTLVVGTYRLHPSAYADDARKVLGVEPKTEATVMAPHAVVTAEDVSYEVSVAHYEDPALQAVFEQKTLGELVQAIARSRVLIPGNEDATVVIYSNVPLPGLLVSPMTLADFDAEHGLMRAGRSTEAGSDKQLRTAIASVLVAHSGLQADGLSAKAAALLGQPVSPARLARCWTPNAPQPGKLDSERNRARSRLTEALGKLGVSDEQELEELLEAWTGPASQLTGDFWVETSRGLVSLPGTALTRTGRAQADGLVAAALRLKAARGRA